MDCEGKLYIFTLIIIFCTGALVYCIGSDRTVRRGGLARQTEIQLNLKQKEPDVSLVSTREFLTGPRSDREIQKRGKPGVQVLNGRYSPDVIGDVIPTANGHIVSPRKVSSFENNIQSKNKNRVLNNIHFEGRNANHGSKQTHLRIKRSTNSNSTEPKKQDGGGGLDNKSMVAMFVILPCIIIVYGGCGVIYCCYRVKRFIGRSRKTQSDQENQNSDESKEGENLETEDSEKKKSKMARHSSSSGSLPSVPNSVEDDEEEMILEIRSAMSDAVQKSPTKRVTDTRGERSMSLPSSSSLETFLPMSPVQGRRKSAAYNHGAPFTRSHRRPIKETQGTTELVTEVHSVQAATGAYKMNKEANREYGANRKPTDNRDYKASGGYGANTEPTANSEYKASGGYGAKRENGTKREYSASRVPIANSKYNARGKYRAKRENDVSREFTTDSKYKDGGEYGDKREEDVENKYGAHVKPLANTECNDRGENSAKKEQKVRREYKANTPSREYGATSELDTSANYKATRQHEDKMLTSRQKSKDNDVNSIIEEIEAIPLGDFVEVKKSQKPSLIHVASAGNITETSAKGLSYWRLEAPRRASLPRVERRGSDTSRMSEKSYERKHMPDVIPMVGENVYPIIKSKKSKKKIFFSS